MPDEVYQKPRGVKMFIYGSTIFHLEQLEKEQKKQQARKR